MRRQGRAADGCDQHKPGGHGSALGRWNQNHLNNSGSPQALLAKLHHRRHQAGRYCGHTHANSNVRAASTNCFSGYGRGRGCNDFSRMYDADGHIARGRNPVRSFARVFAGTREGLITRLRGARQCWTAPPHQHASGGLPNTIGSSQSRQ